MINTVFIKNKSIGSARKAFTKAKKLGWANQSIPTTRHLHESEIPDGEIIPKNEFTNWHYSLEFKTVEREYTIIELLKNGKRLNKGDADFVWSEVLQKLHYIAMPRENLSGYSMPRIRFSASDDTHESLEEAFKQMNIVLQEKKVIKHEMQEIDRQIGVFIPVRYLKNKVYLCKNIIDYFNLSSKVGGDDLFDESDKLASFNFTYEVEYVDQETFTYLRKDFLDKYLYENQLSMFTIVWGERDYYPEDGNWMKRSKKLDHRQWAEFYEAKEYKLRLTNARKT